MNKIGKTAILLLDHAKRHGVLTKQAAYRIVNQHHARDYWGRQQKIRQTMQALRSLELEGLLVRGGDRWYLLPRGQKVLMDYYNQMKEVLP